MLTIKKTDTGDIFETKGIRLPFTLKSPFMNERDGSFTYTFSFDLTDVNKRLTGYVHRLEKFGDFVNEIDVTVEHSGLFLWRGLMKCTIVKDKTIEAAIALGKGELFYLIKDKFLADLLPDDNYTVGSESYPYGPNGEKVTNITGFDTIVNKFYPEVNFAVFPVNNPGATDSLGKIHQEFHKIYPVINDWDLIAQKFINKVAQNHFIDPDNKHFYLYAYNIFSPFPYNTYVLKNIFSKLGFNFIKNPFETDQELNKLVLFHNKSINARSRRIIWDQDLNAWTHTYQLSPEIQFNLKDHLPDVLIQDYIQALEQQFFCGFFVNNNNHSVEVKFLKDIILNPDYEEYSDGVISITEINLEKPDEISKLIQTFDSADANSAMLKNIDDYNITAPLIGWSSDLSIPAFGVDDNKMTLVTRENKYYLAKPNEEEYVETCKWEQFCFDYFLEKKLTDEGKDYLVKCSGVPSSGLYNGRPYMQKWNDNWVNYYMREWLLPDANQPFKIKDAIESYKNQSSLRFLFYRGMQKGKTWEGTDQFKVVNFYELTVYRDDDNTVLQQFNLSEVYYDPSPIPAVTPIYSTWYSYEMILGNMEYCRNEKKIITQVRVPNMYQDVDGNWQTASTYPTGTDRRYPMASADVYDTYNNKIPEANYSLKWDGEYGIVAKFGQPVIDFLKKAKPVKILKRMTPEQLKNIDFSKKKRINGNDFLITQVNGELSERDISICELIGYKF